MGTRQSSLLTRTEVRRGMRGIRIAPSRLETWLDMKMYVPSGSILSSPRISTLVPVNHTAIRVILVAIQYRNAALPVIKVQGKTIRAAAGMTMIMNAAAESMRRNGIMQAARRAVVPTCAATFHRFLQNRHWKELRPRRPDAVPGR